MNVNIQSGAGSHFVLAKWWDLVFRLYNPADDSHLYKLETSALTFSSMVLRPTALDPTVHCGSTFLRLNSNLYTWPSKPFTTRPHFFLQPRFCLVPRKTSWKTFSVCCFPAASRPENNPRKFLEVAPGRARPRLCALGDIHRPSW